MEKAYMVNIRGRVTGVGFRFSTLDKAGEFPGLKGYVRNAGRDHVEVFLQGEEADVDAMLAWLREGPRFARVDEFEMRETGLSKEIGRFDII